MAAHLTLGDEGEAMGPSRTPSCHAHPAVPGPVAPPSTGAGVNEQRTAEHLVYRKALNH